MEKVVTVSKDIAASPDQIWALVTDLTSMGRWSPENDGGNWTKGATGPALGAKFKGDNSWEGKSWKAPVTITEFEAPTRFAFEMRVPLIGGADWSFDIEPTENGSKVTQTWIDRRTKAMKIIGGKLSGVPDRVSHTRMSMETTLNNLANEIES
ncbi:MAG: SRPBCC family protein [Actinomycetota bacterium]|nr:SRPBCC family protein [Actinomycetota bacterium]